MNENTIIPVLIYIIGHIAFFAFESVNFAVAIWCIGAIMQGDVLISRICAAIREGK